MSPLSSDSRNILERAIVKARDIAEDAAGIALTTLAIMSNDPINHLTSEQSHLRNALRAKALQLGDGVRENGLQPLIEEVAYEQWHNRLFARFLAENDLLIHPEGVPVTLEICAELAFETGEGDAWQLAARYASAMLPGIFRVDDPAMQVQFAPESRHKLEEIIMDLPTHLFTTDDALGWVYQFWQTKKKIEVNRSGRKIGASDISPVTQLFTEHYMVQFLLDNTLGAWWAARHPTSPLIERFVYLRFLDDGTPAAGTFPGWPEHVAELTIMDPCCGSGHFLVAAFDMLYRMRMEEEGLSKSEAINVVICDNIYGLELDDRCTQITVFALAFAAWKTGGYRQLSLPNIACSGIAVEGQLETWTRLAGDEDNLRFTLEHHYHLFKNAPDLGSLINPNDTPIQSRLFHTDYNLIEPLLTRALMKESSRNDPIATVFGATAEGVAKAAKLLSETYTLVLTNVPYLGSKKQDEILKQFCVSNHPDAKMDLATTFIERCRTFTKTGGTYAIVTPQNWCTLGSYLKLRKKLLTEQTIQLIAMLGTKAFQTPMYDFNIMLSIFTKSYPPEKHVMIGIDASQPKLIAEKDSMIRSSTLQFMEQAIQLKNPNTVISFETVASSTLLENYAVSPRGIVAGDLGYWVRLFWELPEVSDSWRFLQGTVSSTQNFAGREHIINWSTNGVGMLRPGLGNHAYGRQGIAVNRMADLANTLFTGELYEQGIAVIVPHNPKHLVPIWLFCKSSAYRTAVRHLDQKVGVTSATLVKVPFDLEYWQKVADEAGPLPEPYSNDPTQWLFEGNLVDSTSPLQVAIARLLNYSWPEQKADELDAYDNTNNILCLSSVAGEGSAIERLRELLAITYGDAWSADLQDQLLQEVGFGGKNLEIWLRDGFFDQHCRLFHNRPFLWHIWDGRKDGFSAIVNYHYLDAAALDKLTYFYLGSWINTQRSDRDSGIAGAEARLMVATNLQEKLKAIRLGEAPLDIYVRWKKLHEQPLGWNPDLNDGVRLNIRPFVEAGILRNRFTINWNKDRGNNPDGSERVNDDHKTLDEKYDARAVLTQ